MNIMPILSKTYIKSKSVILYDIIYIKLLHGNQSLALDDRCNTLAMIGM